MPRSTRLTVATLIVTVSTALATGCVGSAEAERTPRAPSPTATETPSPAATAAVITEPTTLVEDLSAPWSILPIDGGVLVSERDTGLIYEVDDEGTVTEVAHIASVKHGGEGGLLGLASPDGARIYVYSTGADGNRVERYLLGGQPGAREWSGPAPVLAGLPSASTHNGGRIAFGPDGMLYVAVGDAQQPDLAQDPDSLAGKILRVTADGAIPQDNPDPESPVYSLGHRNVQGLAWLSDGRLVASEFGQDTWDELNIIEAGGNYGWPVVEGEGEADAYVNPIAVWPTSEASPSGIAVVDDLIVLANLRGEALRVVDPADTENQAETFTDAGRLRDVIVGADGNLWVLTNNTDGRGDARDGDDRIVVIPVSDVLSSLSTPAD